MKTLLRRSSKLTINSLSFLSLSFPSVSLASAWNQQEGHTQLINNFFYNHINSYYDRNSEEVSQPDFVKFEYKPYVEYGLTNDITIGGGASLQALESEGFLTKDIDSNYGLVSSEAFVRKNFYRFENQVASFEAMVEIPGFYSYGETPTFGKKDYFGTLKTSYGIGTNAFFINADTAIRSRFHDTIDTELGMQSISSIKGGLKHKQWELILGLNYTKSLTGYTGFSNTNRYGFDALKNDITIAKHFGNTTISFSAVSDMWGKNVGKSNIGIISISKSF